MHLHAIIFLVAMHPSCSDVVVKLAQKLKLAESVQRAV